MNDLLYNRKQRLATEEEGAGVGVEGWGGGRGIGYGFANRLDWTRASSKKKEE